MILVIIWVISFLVYHVSGGLIHILLVIAVISLILGVIRKA
ncbi:MAG: lmo0937 family membrane protein [Ginsengibacter sp.]